MLPEFNEDGNLPVGVYQITEQEIKDRFGTGSARRQWLQERLSNLLKVAISTKKVKQIFIWGSFVTSKESPNDLDILLVMNETFQKEELLPEYQVLFEYNKAKLQFNADVFWATTSIGTEMLQRWLDIYQTTRNFKRRGIVEVILT